MSRRPDLGGPVSAALASEIAERVRSHGVVLWLDLDGEYTAFAERLAAAQDDLPFAVRCFRGSFLELMMASADLAGGATPRSLLVHLPGFNEERIKRTPLFELYRAGVRYRKKLHTLIAEAAAGRVIQEDIEAFRNTDGVTLEAADAWLRTIVDDPTGGLAGRLQREPLAALIADLDGRGPVAVQAADPECGQVVWNHLAARIGMPASWPGETADADPAGGAPVRRLPADIGFAAASWALAVEYVDDLRRPPSLAALAPATALPRALVDACRELARTLRDDAPDFYARLAAETEELLDEEVAGARAEDLGEIDTFRFEERRVLEAALVALEAGNWPAAADWARLRLRGGSFWLRREPSRANAWQLVDAAARLGMAIAAAGDRLAGDGRPLLHLDDAIARYTEAGAAVDRAHRQMEQLRHAMLGPAVPEFTRLRAALDAARDAWRAWADRWAVDFNRLCVAQGFLPDDAHQQRTIFDQVVRPLTRDHETTAYFVVDALRYELAAQLAEELADTPSSRVELGARLAELPTVTAVGMNALAPVAQGGRLYPHIKGRKLHGFSTGEFRVSTPETRRKAMHERVGGSTCPLLTVDDVLERDTASLKRTVAKARLVLVHGTEIDDAGEKGVGLSVFDDAVRRLRAVWRVLREAGVRRFVITADHGFLLLHDAAASARQHGRKIDPSRRHVLTDIAEDGAGQVRVPLADLRYEDTAKHLLMPEAAGIFDIGKREAGFVHGGNSLQERVIPVLTIIHRNAAGDAPQAYRVEASRREGVGGMHAVKVQVLTDAQGRLGFAGRAEVELTLAAVDPPGVQVEVCDARDGARVERGAVVAPVEAPFEVFFRLRGPDAARARVEIRHPGAAIQLEPFVVAERFEVSAWEALTPELPGDIAEIVANADDGAPHRAPEPAGAQGAAASGAAALGAGAEPVARTSGSGTDWLTALPEGGVRDVFAHLDAHGVVTEGEAQALLGSARAARRFARQFEAHARLVPFRVTLTVVGGVKRYVREGGAG